MDFDNQNQKTSVILVMILLSLQQIKMRMPFRTKVDEISCKDSVFGILKEI